jgi:hypothetical protein
MWRLYEINLSSKETLASNKVFRQLSFLGRISWGFTIHVSQNILEYLLIHQYSSESGRFSNNVRHGKAWKTSHPVSFCEEIHVVATALDLHNHTVALGRWHRPWDVANTFQCSCLHIFVRHIPYDSRVSATGSPHMSTSSNKFGVWKMRRGVQERRRWRQMGKEDGVRGSVYCTRA